MAPANLAQRRENKLLVIRSPMPCVAGMPVSDATAFLVNNHTAMSDNALTATKNHTQALTDTRPPQNWFKRSATSVPSALRNCITGTRELNRRFLSLHVTANTGLRSCQRHGTVVTGAPEFRRSGPHLVGRNRPSAHQHNVQKTWPMDAANAGHFNVRSG
jgi:hypothetical protein